MSDGQARFPEQELRHAQHHIARAATAFDDDFAALLRAASRYIDQAIDAHDALRERCLVAEMQLGQLKGAA